MLYNAHLIYTSLALDDMRVLYSYLVSYNGAVSNQKLNRVPFGRIPTAASQPGGGSSWDARGQRSTLEGRFGWSARERPDRSKGGWVGGAVCKRPGGIDVQELRTQP